MKNLLVYTTLFLCFFSSACQEKEKSLKETIQKSVTWMWEQQSADGGWHSQTHAVLRDGKVLTPYILFYLLQLPKEEFKPQQEAIDKAVAFIISNMSAAINEDSTTLIDYPNYSAAYALRVLHKLDRDTALQHIIANYLLEQQFLEHRGFNADSLAYGGWGYGEPDLKSGEHGHVDVSHTRRIVEALVEGGYIEKKEEKAERAEKAETCEEILLFLKGVQRTQEDNRMYEGCISRSQLPYDGGFVSSVVTLETNKSQPVFIDGAGYHYPSYATATCDGLLAMEALEMQDTPLYSDAVNWLKKNNHYSTIDGLSVNDPEQWTYVMHYYHLAVRAEAMSIIDRQGSWRDSISSMLIKEQLPGDYYLNPLGGMNKEDDPLMATIFCIQAGRILLETKM